MIRNYLLTFFSKLSKAANMCAAFFVSKSRKASINKKPIFISALLVLGGAVAAAQPSLNSQNSLKAVAKADSHPLLNIDLSSHVESIPVVAEDTQKVIQSTPDSSRTSITMKNTVTTNQQNSKSHTHIETNINGSTNRQTITTEDGNTIRYNVSAGPDAEVKVRERNGKLKIDIKEKREF